MFWIEFLGVAAGLLIYAAMLVKRLIIIRTLLLLGALGFLSYGLIQGLPAIIIVNILGVVIGICGLTIAIKRERRTN